MFVQNISCNILKTHRLQLRLVLSVFLIINWAREHKTHHGNDVSWTVLGTRVVFQSWSSDIKVTELKNRTELFTSSQSHCLLSYAHLYYHETIQFAVQGSNF